MEQALRAFGQLGRLLREHRFDKARAKAHDRSTFFAFSSWPAPSCPEGIITAIVTSVSQAPLADTSKSTRQLAARTGTAHALLDKNPIPAAMNDKYIVMGRTTRSIQSERSISESSFRARAGNPRNDRIGKRHFQPPRESILSATFASMDFLLRNWGRLIIYLWSVWRGVRSRSAHGCQR